MPGRTRSYRLTTWIKPELMQEFSEVARKRRYSRDGAVEEAAVDFVCKYKGTCDSIKEEPRK